MNKVTPVIAIILVSFVFIFCFGYFLESDAARHLYATSFVHHRAVETPAENAPFVVGSQYAVLGANELIRLGGGDGGEGKPPHEADQVQGESDDDYSEYNDESSSSLQGVPRNSSTPLEVLVQEWKAAHSTNMSSLPLGLAPASKRDSIKGQKYLPGPDPHSLNVQRKLGEIYGRGGKERSKGTGSKYGVLNRGNDNTMFVRQPRSQNWRNLPKELYRLAPFIFDTVPKQFVPEFKNPCWYAPNRQLQCLPYFYILGFPKCGTTDLWDKINNHPKVSRTRAKETHFWRDHKIGSSSAFYKYLSNSMFLSHRLLAGDTGAVYCDGSATTIITHCRFVQYFPNVTNMYTNVDIIKELTPKAKMIIAIREPVSRLYSGYLYHPMKEKRSARGFHEEALKYISDFNRCLKRDEEQKCIFEKRLEDGRSQRLKTGIYAPYIKAWVDGFGFDQVMVIRLEDWEVNCTSILPKIFEFLELDVLDTKSVWDLCNGQTKNVNSKPYTSIGDMLPSTKKLLEEFYVPYNEELADYLNIPVYHAKP